MGAQRKLRGKIFILSGQGIPFNGCRHLRPGLGNLHGKLEFVGEGFRPLVKRNGRAARIVRRVDIVVLYGSRRRRVRAADHRFLDSISVQVEQQQVPDRQIGTGA